jgi:hypothetical protein
MKNDVITEKNNTARFSVLPILFYAVFEHGVNHKFDALMREKYSEFLGN